MKTDCTTPPINVRKLPAYVEGCRAAASHNSECPHKNSGRFNPARVAWWTGFADASVRRNLRDVFLRRGIEFP